jgi:hypothetical protein
MMMKAWVIKSSPEIGKLGRELIELVENVPIPEPQKGEIVIKTQYCGIAIDDIRIPENRFLPMIKVHPSEAQPFIPGRRERERGRSSECLWNTAMPILQGALHCWAWSNICLPGKPREEGRYEGYGGTGAILRQRCQRTTKKPLTFFSRQRIRAMHMRRMEFLDSSQMAAVPCQTNKKQENESKWQLKMVVSPLNA